MASELSKEGILSGVISAISIFKRKTARNQYPMCMHCQG